MSGFPFGHRNGLMRVANLLLFAALPGSAQTQINLKTQSKAIDFANATSTRPAKTGTAIPALCATGEVFFKSDAPAGSNLYGCTATNIWSLMSGSGGSGGGGALGGDVTGNSSTATVVGLRNRSISIVPPSHGQVLGWNGTTNLWEPQTPSQSSGSSTGSGVPVPFQTILTGGVLSIGAACTTTSPCTARFGNSSYQFLNSASATISGGTGTAYVYVSASGSLTVGHTMTVSCAGCTAVSGVTSFPVDSIPLYTWAANSSGQWDAAGGIDWRSVLSTTNVIAGTGLVGTNVGGATIISLDTAVVGMRVAVPASAASACESGYWAADASFFYLCQAVNSWRRMPISAW